MSDVSRRTFIGTTLAMTTLAAADYRIVDSHVHTWKHDPEFPFAPGANVPTRDAAPETLLAIRNHIAGRHQEFRRIVGARAVRQLFGELQGERLARVPKGFCAQHPAADLLRFKQLFLYVELPPDLATSPALYGEILKRFRAMRPFLAFLTAPPKGRRSDVTQFVTKLSHSRHKIGGD